MVMVSCTKRIQPKVSRGIKALGSLSGPCVTYVNPLSLQLNLVSTEHLLER